MIKNSYIIICLAALCLAVLAPIKMAKAGDEDTTASVYLVFDAETGEFIEINDEDKTRQKHDAVDPADAALALGSPASNSQTGSAPKEAVLASIAIVVALLAIFAAWRRRVARY